MPIQSVEELPPGAVQLTETMAPGDALEGPAVKDHCACAVDACVSAAAKMRSKAMSFGMRTCILIYPFYSNPSVTSRGRIAPGASGSVAYGIFVGSFAV